MLRKIQLDRLRQEDFDVLVVGGGINGAVSALTLSAQGYKTALVEQKDFSSFTSQESSSLAWGGIKYMESYEFGLVWGLCRSRNELLRAFPSQVKEIRFYTALENGFRKSRFLIFLGTWLYWLMGRMFTLKPRLLNLVDIEKDEPQIKIEKSQGGVEYSDSYFIDTDARFVFNLVRKAIDHGCAAVNYLEAKDFKWDANSKQWSADLVDHSGSEDAFTIRTKAIINATGPYADRLNRQLGIKSGHRHLFSKGVHLIVPRIANGERILTFFADDGRMFFVIPMGKRSCIGTTDTRVTDLPPVVTEEDRNFILNNINKRLSLPQPLTTEDIIYERCGVRPLVVESGRHKTDDDWISLSRKHVVECDAKSRVISIFGGKLTDCLNVGREVADLIDKWNLKKANKKRRLHDHWLSEPSVIKPAFDQEAQLIGIQSRDRDRIWRRFLHRSFTILDEYRENPELREEIFDGAELTKAEVELMARHEMIVTLDDFLRRRTTLALEYSKADLKERDGIRDICTRLFGRDAEKKYQEYFLEDQPLRDPTIHPMLVK